MKPIKGEDVAGKRVLLRCDLNAPLSDDGKILDDFRIQKSLPTIRLLMENGAKIAIISHLSSEEKGAEPKTLLPVAKKLEEELGADIELVDDVLNDGARVLNALPIGGVCLFENIRKLTGETEDDSVLAEKLASMADLYVNDAFGVSHRAHASVHALAQRLPAFAGELLISETKTISEILNNPQRPLVAIIGGAKLKTKIKVIENLMQKADHVLLGGNVANVILQAKGLTTSGEMPKEEILNLANKIDITNPKIHLPIDASCGLSENDHNDYFHICTIGTVRKEEMIYDIGAETIKLYTEIIKQAKTIFINGPLGLMEDSRFTKGTLEIFKAIKASQAFCLAGGGETSAFLKAHNLMDAASYISTGGGAMLEFVEGAKLPGLEVLGYYE